MLTIPGATATTFDAELGVQRGEGAGEGRHAGFGRAVQRLIEQGELRSEEGDVEDYADGGVAVATAGSIGGESGPGGGARYLVVNRETCAAHECGEVDVDGLVARAFRVGLEVRPGLGFSVRIGWLAAGAGGFHANVPVHRCRHRCTSNQPS